MHANNMDKMEAELSILFSLFCISTGQVETTYYNLVTTGVERKGKPMGIHCDRNCGCSLRFFARRA